MKTSNEVIDKIIELATEKNISITQIANECILFLKKNKNKFLDTFDD